MSDLLIQFLILAGGVALLIAGGELLVRGAVTMSARLGVSPLLIGLTVVAFGTSAPELSLNVIASIKGNDGLSFGNIVGSNIANIGLILGVAAMIRPMRVHSSIIKRELPIMIALTLLATGMAVWPWPTPDWRSAGLGITRPDGTILLLTFGAFLIYTYRAARRQRGERGSVDHTFADEVVEFSESDVTRPIWLAVVFFLVGLGLLLAGGQFSEASASSIARGLGLSDGLIGLTIVAVATSLPELATCVIAARKGHADIAVGNVVGSNIFNLSLVLGTTACVNPVALPEAGVDALFVMVLLSILLVPMSRTNGRMLSRFEGFTLLLIYGGAMTYEVAKALNALG